MHRCDDAEPRGVPAVVVGEVAALERRIVAEEEGRLGTVAEPGVVIPLDVPKMVVRIDDREVCHGETAGGAGGPGIASIARSRGPGKPSRSEEHKYELQSLMRISNADVGLKKK